MSLQCHQWLGVFFSNFSYSYYCELFCKTFKEFAIYYFNCPFNVSSICCDVWHAGFVKETVQRLLRLKTLMGILNAPSMCLFSCYVATFEKSECLSISLLILVKHSNLTESSNSGQNPEIGDFHNSSYSYLPNTLPNR